MSTIFVTDFKISIDCATDKMLLIGFGNRISESFIAVSGSRNRLVLFGHSLATIESGLVGLVKYLRAICITKWPFQRCRNLLDYWITSNDVRTMDLRKILECG